MATSAGLGHSMVQAQSYMDTEQLIALMFLAALVGVAIDRSLTYLNKKLTKWRYVN